MGSPRVFQGYPDPYPPEPAPMAWVGVLVGFTGCKTCAGKGHTITKMY